MYTIRLFQEASQQSGIGGYVWLALLIFLLMVFLGWWVSNKGWLKKDETTPTMEHGHDAHEVEHPHGENHPAGDLPVAESAMPTTTAAISAGSVPVHAENHPAENLPEAESAMPATMAAVSAGSDQGAAATPAVQPTSSTMVSTPAVQPTSSSMMSIPADQSASRTMVSVPADQPANSTMVSTPAVLPTSAPKVSTPDDLTLLEGIGPKVAKVLAGVGITTFEGLAKADYASLKATLESVGYRYMDPAGWIDQAVLAAKGDTEGLKKLQDSLKGGRRVA